MPLTSGTRLGPYEIVTLAGAGGMGEVYKARDTRLERTVAVKVLPSDRCAAPEARQRLEREARTISQLSHPHICALFDIGHHDGVDYLVMEYVEGETLSDRLARGALPLDQTLRHGIEIAGALHKAHRQGIVHRDLKPGNVMLTRSGVKLLDFGLAKSDPPATTPEALTAMPTKAALTQEGTIVGTVPYMAPEQLEGKGADARTDIFALGAVLYEMATGRRAFTGASHASLISSIMKDEPAPIAQIQPAIPPALDHVVTSCLRKDPEERWQSAGDVERQLEWIAEGGGGTGVVSVAAAPAPAARTATREWIAWGLAIVALIVASAALLRGGQSHRESAGPMRLSILLPDKSALRCAVLSPDGARIVLVARDASGRNLLWIRSLSSLALEPLAGTENPSYPFWSPDGRHIGFFADGKLKKIDASGGPPQTLCDAPLNRGGSWGRDGTILLAPAADGPLYKVSGSGGPATQVTRFDRSRGETTHRWPFFLPDGRHYLYLVASFSGREEREKMGVYAGSLDSPVEKFLVKTSANMAYAPPGYLLFLRERNLLAQAFDPESLQLSGEPFPVATQVQYFPQIYSALFSVSETGTLLYQNATASGISQLVWFDRSGKNLGPLGPPADQSCPRISPDGRRVAVAITDPHSGNMDIWTYDASGGIGTRLTSHPAIDGIPIWSPDGSRIAYMSFQGGHPDLFQRSSNGAGSEEVVVESDRTKYPTDWSPDGRFLLYREAANLELWAKPLAGDGKPVPFIRASFGVTNGQFSPDGRFVAYSSNESGRWEIYVAPFPDPGGNWKVSSDGGSEPIWRRDGKELFYLAPDGHLMSVTVRLGASFDADPPKTMFQVRRREPVATLELFSYSVSPDGQRFLVNIDAGEPTTPPLTAVLHWDSEAPK